MKTRQLIVGWAFTLLCVFGSGLSSAEETSDHNERISVVAENLAGPYGIFFDTTDLIVTTKGELLRIKDPTVDMSAAERQVEHIAPVGQGDALGAMLFGSTYVVLSCDLGCTDSAQLQEIRRDGTTRTVGGPKNAVEVARWGDNYLVSDPYKSQLVEVTPDGNMTVFSNDKLAVPAGLYVDGDKVWVTDFSTGQLLVLDKFGTSTIVASGLGSPVGIAYDGNSFIVADFAMGQPNMGRVLRVSRTGEVKVIAKPGKIGNPSAVALFGPDIYVSDIINNTVTRIRGNRLRDS